MSEALRTGMNLPLNEALSMGGETTVIGLGIVFGVLVILMIVLMLFKVIFYRQPKAQTQKTVSENAVAAKMAVETKEDDTDEEELIAVMTAAIAASLNTSTYNLKIKSYRRVDNNVPAWNKAGLNEAINNRF